MITINKIKAVIQPNEQFNQYLLMQRFRKPFIDSEEVRTDLLELAKIG